MESLPENKTVRLLEIYTHLIKGDVLSKTELATQYHISRRSIQRDMEALRAFIANQNLGQDVVYDYKHRGYRLIQTNPDGSATAKSWPSVRFYWRAVLCARTRCCLFWTSWWIAPSPTLTKN